MTTAIPRLKLNRLITIRAMQETQADSLISWRFGTYSAEPLSEYIGLFGTELPSLGRYAWVDENDSTLPFENVDSAQAIVDAAPGDLEIGNNAIQDDGMPNRVLPIPGDVLEHADLLGMEVRFSPVADTESYVSFISDGRSDYPTNDGKHGEYFFIRVRPGTLERTGADFTLGDTEEILVSIEGQLTDSSLSGSLSTNRGVWAELTERGIQQGISTSGDILSTSREQTASAVVRYRSDFLAAETVTDDLAREWRVTSTRPFSDRRYLSLDLVRVIGASN